MITILIIPFLIMTLHLKSLALILAANDISNSPAPNTACFMLITPY